MKESGGCVPGRCGGTRRAISPSGCSTLITSAPKSARMQPHIGPAQVVVTSTTRRPASGPLRSRRASPKNSRWSTFVVLRSPPAGCRGLARRAFPWRGRDVTTWAAEGRTMDLGKLLVATTPGLVDLALFAGRIAIGVCFVIHGLGKLGLVGTGSMQGFVAWLRELGVPHAAIQ